MPQAGHHNAGLAAQTRSFWPAWIKSAMALALLANPDDRYAGL